jgi:uncharacterized membrane protein (Fun14 family)
MADNFGWLIILIIIVFIFSLALAFQKGTTQINWEEARYIKKKTGREKSFLNVRLTSSVEIVEITLGDRLRGGMI